MACKTLSSRHRLFKLLIGCWMLVMVALFHQPLASASAQPDIAVYRDPSCTCCGGWIKHLSAQGFQPQNISTPEIESIKRQYGVPDSLASCHTAIVDGYVIEGHVPAADIKQLLAERPDVVGIAVPGMPVGTPGMESEGRQDDFTVFSFDREGNGAAFRQHSF